MRKSLLILVGILALSGCGYEISYDSENGLEGGQMDMEGPGAGYGFIEGGLSYPSERIPDNLRVCTENEMGSSCGTYQSLEGDEYKYGVGYRIEVPAGSYKVFSRTEVGGFDPVIGGYTECGDANECESHKLLMVEVKDGEIVTGIDLEDFQAEFY